MTKKRSVSQRGVGVPPTYKNKGIDEPLQLSVFPAIHFVCGQDAHTTQETLSPFAFRHSSFRPRGVSLIGMAEKLVRRGVFPGQFDPVTNGHLDIIRRGVMLFDELIVAVGVNPDKRELFSLAERVEMIRELVADVQAIKVTHYTGLTMDFVKQAQATTILRGIRDATDLRYEFQLAMANRTVGGVETVFIMTGDQFALTSSSLIRQVVTLGGDVGSLKAALPESVIARLRAKQQAGQLVKDTRPDAPAN